MSSKNYNVLSTSILILILIQILFPIFYFKDNLYIITSNSMYPTLKKGDLVIKINKSSEKIIAHESEGDILIIKGPQYYYEQGIDPFFFNYLANDTPIIHRAVDKKKIGEIWYFLTKGDNNLIPDGAMRFIIKKNGYYLVECDFENAIYIPETEILGVVGHVIPYIGYLGLYFPIIIILIMGISLIFFINYLKKIKKLKEIKMDYIR